jgi:spore maturation protein CgeB
VKHLKGRDFEVPMTGALYLTTFNEELSRHFDIGREILCYGSYAECAEIIVRMLRAPDQAQAIRTAGHARALRDHTWRRRIGDLFDALAVR